MALWITLQVRLGAPPLPDWREYAPFLWGEGVNYDSDGDAYNAKEPTHWTFLDIENRQTNERVFIRPRQRYDAEGSYHWSPLKSREEGAVLSIEGEDIRLLRLAAYLTALRTQGSVLDPQTSREIPMQEIAGAVADMDARIATANKIRAA